jgi:hypothetical protein
MKRIAGFLISLISVLGINFIPLEMYLYRDFSWESAMIFYGLENILAIGFTAGFVFLFAPKKENVSHLLPPAERLKMEIAFRDKKSQRREGILTGYLLFAAAFGGGGMLFLVAFVLVALKKSVQFGSIASALPLIAGFLLLEFFGDWLMLRPLTMASVESLLKRSMGRIALLYLSVFLGFFLAIFVEWLFFIPFIILKTLADITEVAQIFKTSRRLSG